MRLLTLPLLCAALVLATGCKKDETPAPSNTGGSGGSTALSASTPVSINMTIDGTVVSYLAGSSYSVDNSASSDIATPPAMSLRGYSIYIDQVATANTVFVCDLGRYQYLGGLPTDTQFFGFFPTSPIAFGDWENELNKVGITWWDGNGIEWSTYYANAQPSSSFAITEVLQQPSIGISTVKLRVTFNCRLYHENGLGSYKTVTNGTAVLSYQNI